MKRNKAGQVVVAPDSPSDVMSEVGEVLAEVEAEQAEKEKDANEVKASVKYLNDPKCPVCDSDEIHSECEIDAIDFDHAYQKCGCNKCGATWTEEWTLKAIYKIEKPS